MRWKLPLLEEGADLEPSLTVGAQPSHLAPPLSLASVQRPITERHIGKVQHEGPQVPKLPMLQTNSSPLPGFPVEVVAPAVLFGVTGVVDTPFL